MACLAVPAIAGPVNWAHQVGAVQSNGAVVIKSLNGGSYAGTSNPTGSIVRMNQNTATQPPTVIIKSSLPCYLGMSKEDRKSGCLLGSDVFSDPEGRNKVGKYGGEVSVGWKKGNGGTAPTGTFLQDFVVASENITSRYGCFYEGYDPVPSQGGETLGSVLSLEGYNIPAEVSSGSYWITSSDWGLAMSADFMYQYVTLGKCSSSGRINSAIVQCSSRGKGWYLPSLKELDHLYQNRSILGGFTNGIYWSAQSSGNDAVSYVFDFSNGNSTYKSRNDVYQVRCLRVFNDLIRNY